MSYNFANEHVDCIVELQGNQILVLGTIKTIAQFDYAEIIAANPIDRMMSYNGSGLPFPCANIAFDHTPNYKKITNDDNGEYRVYFLFPNSYYSEDGYTRVAPSIFFILRKKSSEPVYVRFELPAEPIFNVRTLTYRNKPRQGPQAFQMKEDVVGICGAQETMMRYKDAKLFQDLA